ncbi:adenosine kinase [Dactylosporangium siamense]|uniref:Ribokinase n=1 Tax=Dactylosporangium siamense TaxID=685454 RepID=A0A919PFK4_9ACTN|nr:adenosine kinase [Dactylosporangium siamense]GIG42679.1 ribokinase [Dactylosporangium siamense]
MIDVLVLGGAGVDTVVSVPALPLPPADSHLVPAILTRAGQTGDGVALGLHALGLRTSHLDVLGDDPEGQLVRDLHERHGVPFTVVPTPAGTKRAVNLVDPLGRRSSLYDGSRQDESALFPEPLLRDLAGRARHVHVSITHPCQHALDVLAGLPVTVSTDLHDWDGVNAYHEQFARGADVVFMSAAALPDVPATLRRVLAMGRPRVAVATAGAEGAYLLTRDAPDVLPVPVAALPAPAVDSNGAGDAFVSGFLFGFLTGVPAPGCARFGAVAGAHACTVPSTRVDPLSHADLVLRAGPVS